MLEIKGSDFSVFLKTPRWPLRSKAIRLNITDPYVDGDIMSGMKQKKNAGKLDSTEAEQVKIICPVFLC